MSSLKFESFIIAKVFYSRLLSIDSWIIFDGCIIDYVCKVCEANSEFYDYILKTLFEVFYIF
jgi:hypothetical protein